MKKHIFFVILLITVSLATAGLPYFFSGFFPPWKDTIAVACAVKQIAQNNKLGLGEHFYITYDSPDVPYCWDKNVYPLNQIYMFSAKVFSGLNPALTVALVYLLIYLLIVLGIYLVAWELYKEPYLAFIAGFFSASCLALLRIFTISPHQLFGFLLIIAISWFLIKYNETKQNKFIFLILITLVNLVWFHQFSLAVILVALIIYFIAHLKKKIYIISILAIGIVAILLAAFFLSGYTNPLRSIIGFIYYASTSGMVDLLSAHPIWDHPTILGYALSILGIFGAIYCLFIKKFPLKVFWWTLIIFCLLMAHSYILGFYLIGYRFLFFLFIPFALLAPLLFIYLKDLFPKFSQYLIPILMVFIIISSGFHSINFILDNFYGLSKKVLPPEELKQAINWLNENSKPTETILTTMREDIKYAPYLPYLYQGNVMVYPIFAFTNLKDFNFQSKTFQYMFSDATPNSTNWLAKLIEPYYLKLQEKKTKNNESINPDKQILFDMYQMINYPGSIKKQEIMKKYNVKYMLAWKGKVENNIFRRTNKFEKIYENDLLVIYQNKKLK